MIKSDTETREAAKMAAKFSEEFSDLAIKLTPSTLAYIIPSIILIIGIISEFSLGYELFRPFYLDADGNTTSDTFWRTSTKTLILCAMVYPLEVMWMQIHEASGGDIPHARTTHQKIIGGAFSVLHWVLFAAGIMLLFYIQGHMGAASFQDLASYFQGTSIEEITINGSSAEHTDNGNSKAAEHVGALWATLIVSAFAASLALFHLLRAVNRKKWVLELLAKKQRCDRLSQLLEDQASLDVARDYIRSPEYTRNIMYEAQHQFRDEWLNGIRAARNFLHDARDPKMKIDFKDGEEYVGQRVNIPERDVKLRMVNEAEKALKNLRLMSADISGRFLSDSEDHKPKEPTKTNEKVLDWNAIHNFRKGE